MLMCGTLSSNYLPGRSKLLNYERRPSFSQIERTKPQRQDSLACRRKEIVLQMISNTICVLCNIMNNLLPRGFCLFLLVTSGNKIDILILLQKTSYQTLSKESTECFNKMFQRRRHLLHQGSTYP